jgi:hypothetical protein
MRNMTWIDAYNDTASSEYQQLVQILQQVH